MKVRLISIGHSGEMDSIYLHVWQEFQTKQAGIDFLNDVRHHPAGLSAKQNAELQTLGSTVVGQEHYFILFQDEQRQWLKTLVKETL